MSAEADVEKNRRLTLPNILPKGPLREALETKVSPEALQVMYLDEIAGKMDDLSNRMLEVGDSLLAIKALMPKTPEGITANSSASATETLDSLAFSPAVFSCQINNDGPNPVFVDINNAPSGNAPLNAGDQIVFDMHAPKIGNLYYKCAAGQTASLRMFTVR